MNTFAGSGVVDLPHLQIGTGYATGGVDLLSEFYLPCLTASAAYDRVAGYFRSSLFSVVGAGLSTFALRGGEMRLVCSPALTVRDLNSIRDGEDLQQHLDASLESDLTSILSDPTGRTVLELLSTLVALDKLQIRLAYREGGRGIFHDKRGIFTDHLGNRISFSGSANESLAAWDPAANHESFEVFKSWGDESDQERVGRHVQEFADLWADRAPGITVADLPSIPREMLSKYVVSDGVEAAVDKVRSRILPLMRDPPSATVLRVLKPHQAAAAAAWRSAHFRGIMDHVTGAGKTLTALRLLREWIDHNRPALILVPSELLLQQWRAELTQDFAMGRPYHMLLAGAGQPRSNWLSVLGDMTRQNTSLGPRITIATIQTASTPTFIKRVQGGEHLMIVADEVHRVGSPTCRAVLQLPAGARLGLSATPERFMDPAGTEAIQNYFGASLKPHVGISEAIAAGMLVPYDYQVHAVSLDPDEAQKWQALTDEIARQYARFSGADGSPPVDDRLTFLLIKRARLLKGARQKVAATVNLLQRRYRPGQRWLIYCDSRKQLEGVRRALHEAGLDSLEYHSTMLGSRSQTLDYFRMAGGMMVAIRCLDEGVDIPTVDHALLLSSSTNSREFIQRRGRVLRSTQGKYSAAIHDLLVTIPRPDGGYWTVASEIRRAILFAQHSRSAAVKAELAHLLHMASNTIDLDVEEAE